MSMGCIDSIQLRRQSINTVMNYIFIEIIQSETQRLTNVKVFFPEREKGQVRIK